MSKLSREYQRELLTALSEAYPEALDSHHLPQSIEQYILVPNISYLAEHELVQIGWDMSVSLRTKELEWARITARGLDFLEGDGGLTAILGTVTVRFEAATLKALLAAKVEASDADPEEKQVVLTQIAELTEHGAKHLFTKLLDAGLQRVPQLTQMVQQIMTTM